MTNQEFSDTFDTLINSYNTQASFGEGSSRADIVLDEYEKSVLLTQAQDSIIKQYFQGVSLGAGFDDSTRRQVDFSSLIKTTVLYPNIPSSAILENENIVMRVSISSNLSSYGIESLTIQLYIGNDNSAIVERDGTSTPKLIIHIDGGNFDESSRPSEFSDEINNVLGQATITSPTGVDIDGLDICTFECYNAIFPIPAGLTFTTTLGGTVVDTFDERGIIFYMPKVVRESKEVTDVLFILNEALKIDNKNYVIVPINYKEYDREMSKAYAQPLKKQAWRLFQNPSTGFDVVSEVIPKFGAVSDDSEITYKIRYVRRPVPIVLENLPNNLEIDGVSSYTECELNPSLHYDILQAAVQMAITTRGRQPFNQQQRQREESNSE